MTTYRNGALYVVESASDSGQIARELKALDSRLFLERQMTLTNEVVWCVVMSLGDQPPQTIMEWRGPRDEPIELSYGIVNRIKEMMGRDSYDLGKRAVERNNELMERRRKDSLAGYTEVFRQGERLLAPGHSALLPRGQGLRRSRDKERARGRKV